jgi:hypothetical protein
MLYSERRALLEVLALAGCVADAGERADRHRATCRA